MSRILISILKIGVFKKLTFWVLGKIRVFSIEFAKRAEPNLVRPREWSNEELKKFAHLFDGKIINVSGWKDEDQRGNLYKNYFINASDYYVSNFKGERGAQGTGNEIFIDLTSDLPLEYVAAFDTAFNHTVLEHIYDIHKAVSNICELSRQNVILITPFLQQVHYSEGSYSDYWRPTPHAIRQMLEDNGFTTIYQSSNDNDWYNVYIFTVATKSGIAGMEKNIDATKIGERLFGFSVK